MNYIAENRIKECMPNKILVIFAHPLLERSRINRSIIRKYQGHANVKFHDLYELYPDFNIDIEFEKESVSDNDILILHHPFYWYSCPPLLKQWLDMVLEVGWAYGPDGNALEGKTMMQVITSGGPKLAYSHEGGNKFTIREFLRPFEQTAALCKMKYLPPFVIHGTHRISNIDLADHANQLAGLIGYLSLKDLNDADLSDYQYFNDFLIERRPV